MINQEKSPSTKKYEGKYKEIYGNNQDIQSIEITLKREKFMVQCVIILIFLLISIQYSANYRDEKVGNEYIGGNVLYLSTGSTGEPSAEMYIGNPWLSASLLTQLLFDTLYETDSSFTEVNPKLAENLEILDDGYTYVITLKGNQYWSDGEKITVEDVVFSFEGFLLNPNVNTFMTTAFSKIQGAREFVEGEMDNIAGISVDGNQITIKLDSLHSSFDLTLTQFAPLPKHVLENEDLSTLSSSHWFFINNNGVFSGQYKVGEFDSEQNLVLEQNSYYNNLQSDIEKVVICWDFNHRDIDYYPTSDLSKMISYRSMKGFDEYEVSVYFYRYFIFNLAGGDGNEPHYPMSDIRVRQAVYHAIDIETLMEEIYLGRTTRYFGGAVDIAPTLGEYDPVLARELLEEAEFDFQRTFQIYYYSGDINAKLFVDGVAKYLEAVGMTVETTKVEAFMLYVDPEYDMLMKNLSAFNTADWYSEYLSTNHNMSQLMGREGEFDPLVNKLLVTTDSDRYQEILAELVEFEQEMLYKMPMFLIDEAIYINGNRLFVPDDMVFGNTRYFSDIRLDEWYIKKG